MDNNELKKIMDTPIDDLLDLSSRPFICLKHNAKIELIRDLVKFKARDLLRIRGLGKKTLKEIEYELSIKNLYLGMDLSKIEINDQLNLSNKNSENRITDASGTPNVVNPTVNRELTFGEKLVGLNFNPSNDDDVSKAKRLCADLADLVNKNFYEGKIDSQPLELRHQLFNHTIGEILNAQMNVVKVLTFKY